MRHFMMVLLIFGLTGTVWADDEPEDDSPATNAVEAYVEALFTIDYEGAQAVLCAADLEKLDRAAFEQSLETVTTNRYTADLSELAYDPLDLDESFAEVKVDGTISLTIEGQLQPVEFKPFDFGLDQLWAIYEGKSWKACSQVPPDLIDELEPDVIARVFMNAAYTGDYEQAHLLICESQLEALNEAEFDQLFSTLVEQEIRLDFHETVFEITEQTGERATVTLMGDVLLNMGDRPSPLAVSAEEVGLMPVYLRYEDGWKICSAEPVES